MRRLVRVVLVLGLLGAGWALFHLGRALRREPVSVARPTVSESPEPSVTGTPSGSDAVPVKAPVYACALFTELLGDTPLAGCADVPVRPEPRAHGVHCSPEARATPARLSIKPEEHASVLDPDSGTPASEESIASGGALNLKPGPIAAWMRVEMRGQAVTVRLMGEVVTTPQRAYLAFNQLEVPDGSVFPICGVAVDGVREYGIPTYARLPLGGTKVDPAKVDPSPGSVVLNDPRFETVLEGPPGYAVPRVNLPPPDWR